MASYELGEDAARQIAAALRKIGSLPYAEQAKPRRRNHSSSFGGSGVIVRNDSVEAVPAHGVMRITGTTTVDGEEVFTVAKIGAELQRFVLVNGETEIPAYVTGEAYVYGSGHYCDLQTPVLYDTADGTPVQGQWWGPYPDSWKLRRHCYGFQVTGGVSTERETAFCIQHVVQNIIGKTDSTISKGSTTTVSVWKGDRSADTTGEILLVQNPFSATESGKWVRVVWDSETPSMTALECSA